jgi:hypothetical protein
MLSHELPGHAVIRMRDIGSNYMVVRLNFLYGIGGFDATKLKDFASWTKGIRKVRNQYGQDAYRRRQFRIMQRERIEIRPFRGEQNARFRLMTFHQKADLVAHFLKRRM